MKEKGKSLQKKEMQIFQVHCLLLCLLLLLRIKYCCYCVYKYYVLVCCIPSVCYVCLAAWPRVCYKILSRQKTEFCRTRVCIIFNIHRALKRSHVIHHWKGLLLLNPIMCIKIECLCITWLSEGDRLHFCVYRLATPDPGSARLKYIYYKQRQH